MKSGDGLLLYKAQASMLRLFAMIRLSNENQLNTYRWCLYLHLLQLQYHKTEHTPIWQLYLSDPSVFNEEKGEIALSVLARNLPHRMMHTGVKQFTSTFHLVPDALASAKALGVEMASSGFEDDGISRHEDVPVDSKEVKNIVVHFQFVLRSMAAGTWDHYPKLKGKTGNQLFKTDADMKPLRVHQSADNMMSFDPKATVDFCAEMMLKRVQTSFLVGDLSWPEVGRAGIVGGLGAASEESDDEDVVFGFEDDKGDEAPPVQDAPVKRQRSKKAAAQQDKKVRTSKKGIGQVAAAKSVPAAVPSQVDADEAVDGVDELDGCGGDGEGKDTDMDYEPEGGQDDDEDNDHAGGGLVRPKRQQRRQGSYADDSDPYGGFQSSQDENDEDVQFGEVDEHAEAQWRQVEAGLAAKAAKKRKRKRHKQSAKKE